MAKRNVIVRRLVAVESLGSCTYIATDKTGTLTVNQLTAKRIKLATGEEWGISGEGMLPDGQIETGNKELLERICMAAILPNEGFFGRRGDDWVYHGDAVDVAFLVMAHKGGFIRAELLNNYPQQHLIPFESEHLFAASLNEVNGIPTGFVKGAVERILPMCSRMADGDKDATIDSKQVQQQLIRLADQGYRVLAVASGEIELKPNEEFSREHMNGFTLLALVGLIDPLRSESRQAIIDCRSAGIQVGMVTGDHPLTALAIARQLQLENDAKNIISGEQLKQAKTEEELDTLVSRSHVFARVEPTQKLDIVHSLQRQGHFVAVSGDGANDAPALRAAEVGVAMGKSGTDVARETAELIITDDNFASMVAGIEEGRVAYANVRKV
ncbi:MAG: HAD-IC family P-type ATPase, partial [Gammaproteobacteria bacterium]|nr:HAD-IC family P-type ATPase [Gammaproteobacteria bacterium]